MGESTVKCPECGKSLRVREEQAGKRGKCPGCGRVLDLPALARGRQRPPDGGIPGHGTTEESHAEASPSGGPDGRTDPGLASESPGRGRATFRLGILLVSIGALVVAALMGGGLGTVLGMALAPFALSAAIVFPIAGIGWLVEWLISRRLSRPMDMVPWHQVVKWWAGFAVVILLVALIGMLFT